MRGAGFRVVIVGGGIGGLATALTLARSRNSAIDLTLIDRQDRHSWKPMLHNFAAGTASENTNTVPFADLARRHGFTFLQGAPNGIDRRQRRLSMPDGTKIPYDLLVIALGGRSDPYGIPGVAAHGTFLDTLPDALAIRRIFENIRHGSGHQTIGIVGGGPTGVQMAGEFRRVIASMTAATCPHIMLIESGQRLLPSFPSSVSESAETRLRQLGITIHTNTRIDAVTPDGFQLSNGKILHADLRLWAAGVRANAATSVFECALNPTTGRILIDPILRTSDPAIHALGDCATMTVHPQAATAQVARQQGQYLGRAIPLIAAGGQPPPFVYRHQGSVVVFGKDDGWSTFGGVVSQGLKPRLLHDALYQRHRIEILGLRQGLSAFLDAGSNSP